jgi:hypothetical protein
VAKSIYLSIRMMTTAVVPSTIPIPPMTYTTGDPAKNIITYPFTTTDTMGFTFLFTLIDSSSGLAADPTLFSLQSETANPSVVVVHSTDNSKSGVYSLAIKAEYNILLTYSVNSLPFTVIVQNQCINNIITCTPSSIESSYKYSIGDPMLNISLG